MNWRHLIEAARLLSGATGASPGRPRQIMLRKAVSSAYYALFHALCSSNANAVIGMSPRADRQAWSRTYRALEHGVAKNRMMQHIVNLPAGMQSFARTFSNLQERRHEADYDPDSRFRRSNVIDRAETAIEGFYAADVAERRAFATLVLLRDR